MFRAFVVVRKSHPTVYLKSTSFAAGSLVWGLGGIKFANSKLVEVLDNPLITKIIIIAIRISFTMHKKLRIHQHGIRDSLSLQLWTYQLK